MKCSRRKSPEAAVSLIAPLVSSAEPAATVSVQCSLRAFPAPHFTISCFRGTTTFFNIFIFKREGGNKNSEITRKNGDEI